MGGEAALWSTSDYLLARIADDIAWGNYQRQFYKGDKPKPIERPGSPAGGIRHVGTPMSFDDLKKRLKKRREDA